MYLHTKFYEAHTLSSIWLKNYLSQMEGVNSLESYTVFLRKSPVLQCLVRIKNCNMFVITLY